MNIIKLNSIHPKSAMIDCVHSHKSCLFQSTTHEECDLGSLGFTELIVCFNPRTHEECDRIYFFSLIFRHLEEGFRELF